MRPFFIFKMYIKVKLIFSIASINEVVLAVPIISGISGSLKNKKRLKIILTGFQKQG